MFKKKSKSKGSKEDSIQTDVLARWRKALSAQGSAWRSRATVLIGRDLLVLGANSEDLSTQLFICDTTSMKWSTAELKGDGPKGSTFYAAVASKQNDRLFVVWSSNQKGKIAKVIQNFEAKKAGELSVQQGKYFIVLDESDSSWIGGTTQDSSTIGIVPRSAISFENVTFQQTTKLELSVLNFTADMQWSTMLCDGDMPKARRFFSLNRVGNKMYLYGGLDDFEICSNAMFVLDLEKFNWKKCMPATKSKDTVVPRAAYGHATLALENNNILLFGGLDMEHKYCNELVLFNSESMTWSVVKTQGIPPEPRAFHSFTRMSEYAVVFGGRNNATIFNDVHVLNLTNYTWCRVRVDGELLTPRYNHFSESNWNHLVFFGGKDDGNFFFDIAFLELEGPTDSKRNSLENGDNLNNAKLSENQSKESTAAPSFVSSTQSSVESESSNRSNEPQPVVSKKETKQSNLEQQPSSCATTTVNNNSTQQEEHSSESKSRNIATSATNRSQTPISDLYTSMTRSPSRSRSSTPTPGVSTTSRPTTPHRSLTKQVFGELSVEEKYSFDKTLGDVQRVTANRNRRSKSSMSNTEDEEAQEEDKLSLQVSFENFMFNAELIDSFDIKFLHEYILDEETYLNELIQIVNQNKHEGITFVECLKLFKRCQLFDNEITWIELLNFSSSSSSNEQFTLQQFKKLLIDIARIKYGKAAKDSNVLSLQWLIEINLRPNAAFAILDDETFLKLTEVDTLQCIAKYSKSLQELYTLYSSLRVSSSMLPSWKDVVKNKSTISLPEFLSFCETFNITPAVIPRHTIIKKIFPDSLQYYIQTSPNIEESFLNFSEFVEAIGRIAIYSFSRYPYSNMYKSNAEKLEALFDLLGFKDKKKYLAYLKKSGVSLQNKISRTEPSNKEQETSPDYDELLKDKDKLRDELQRIFMYYCSFGDHLNLDLMSSSKFQKLIRDIKLKPPGVKPEEADLIFTKLMKNKSQKINSEEYKHQRMTFHYFVEGIKIIATKVYPTMTSTQALVKLLSTYVLPNAQRMPEKFTNVNVNQPDIVSLMEKHKKILQAIFYIYSIPEIPDKSGRHEFMKVHEFVKFLTEFDITASLIAKTDIFIVFRSAILESQYDEITYSQFEECLVKCASVAYSKHPYNMKYFKLYEKVTALLEKIGLPDWSSIKKKLEKMGHIVPNSPLSIGTKYSLDNVKHYNYFTKDYLPSEQELDKILQDIFTFYNEFNVQRRDVSEEEEEEDKVLTQSQFLKLCKDCGLVDSSLTDGQIEAIFTETSQSGMTYHIFCDSLTHLAQKKFTQQSATDALRELLLLYVLPFAQRKNSRDVLDVNMDIVVELKKHEKPMKRIFTHYVDGKNEQGKMREKDLLKFCQDFDIFPSILSITQVQQLFEQSVEGEEEEEHGITYEQFLECLARLSVKAFGSKGNSKNKSKSVVEFLHLNSAVKLAEHLRKVHIQ